MGKDTSRRKKTKRAGRRSKRVKRETPRFPLYRQVGGSLTLLTTLPNGNGATNLAAWYDASDPNGTGTPPSNGASITKWADKSGKGRDLTKTAGTIYYRSSLTDSTPKFNQPAIDFRTTPGGIFLSSSTFNLSTTFSLYIVGVLKDKENYNTSNFFGYTTLFGHYPVRSPGTSAGDFSNQSNFLNMTLYPGNALGRYAQLERPSGTGGEPLRDPDPTVGWLYYGDAPYILSVRADSSTKVMYKLYKKGVNGPYTKPIPETSTLPSTTTPANITMGMSSSGHPIGCYTSEIIYFQEFHTDTQANIIESYLAWKWGLQTAAGGVLSSTSPYTTAQPTASPTLSAGEIASAASAATASAATASGQRASAATASMAIASAAATASMAIASGQRASLAIALAPRQYTSAYNMLTNLPGTTGGSTSLAHWLDASDPNGDGALPSDGASITTWADKSGKARHLYKGRGTINYRKSLTDSNPSFNQPAIDLRTSGGGSLVSTATFNLSQNFSIYLVGVVKAASLNGVNMHWSTIWGHHPVTGTGANVSDYNDRNGFLSITKSGNTSVYLRLDGRDRNSATSEHAAASYTEFDTPFILSYRVIAKGTSSDDRTMMRRYMMGTNVNSPLQYTSVSPFTGNAKVTTTPANIIMGFCPEQQYTGNYLSEAIYFQETHTDQQADVIEAYLAWKWGFQTAAGGVLPSSNPYSGTSTLKTITPEESAATASMAIASGQRASAAIASGQIASAAIASAAIASGQIASGQRASAQIASGQQASAQIASGQIASGQIASGQQASAQIASGQIASGQQASAQIASGQRASAAEASGQIASGQQASAQIVSGQRASAAQESAAIASGQIASGQQASAQIASGQQASAQIVSGQRASAAQESAAIASGQIASGQQASAVIASTAIGIKSLGQDPTAGRFLLRLQPL